MKYQKKTQIVYIVYYSVQKVYLIALKNFLGNSCFKFCGSDGASAVIPNQCTLTLNFERHNKSSSYDTEVFQQMWYDFFEIQAIFIICKALSTRYSS